MYKWIYKTLYLKSLSTLGGMLGESHGKTYENESSVVPPNNSESSFPEIDYKATSLGNTYRGIGVTIGMLGVLIIFCAVAPIGLETGHEATLIFTTIKILMMLAMGALVWNTTRSEMRKNWIDARFRAEVKRYESLKLANDLFEVDLKTHDASVQSDSLAKQLNDILGSQIKYNEVAAKRYSDIERISGYLGWAGYSIALVGAFMHLFMHESWLIFPTAFVPALVGTVHGINSFLHLSDLAEEHHYMFERLEHINADLASCKNQPERVFELSKAVYELLSNRDVQWINTAKKLDLKPA